MTARSRLDRGKNLIIDYRYFEGHPERLPAPVAELVALKSRCADRPRHPGGRRP